MTLIINSIELVFLKHIVNGIRTGGTGGTGGCQGSAIGTFNVWLLSKQNISIATGPLKDKGPILMSLVSHKKSYLVCVELTNF